MKDSTRNLLKRAAAAMGAVGGASGTGEAKRRGDSRYYRRLARRSVMAKLQKAKA